MQDQRLSIALHGTKVSCMQAHYQADRKDEFCASDFDCLIAGLVASFFQDWAKATMSASIM